MRAAHCRAEIDGSAFTQRVVGQQATLLERLARSVHRVARDWIEQRAIRHAEIHVGVLQQRKSAGDGRGHRVGGDESHAGPARSQRVGQLGHGVAERTDDSQTCHSNAVSHSGAPHEP